MSDHTNQPLPVDTEAARRALVATMPAELVERVMAGEEFYTTDEMRELFTVEGFGAPFVVVTRKSDGRAGVLSFTHSPRFYFDFQPSK